jgi:predicted  nucleic acid-binding Zn-ribbon protein
MNDAGGWLPSVVTALLAFAASYLGYRQATRAARTNARIEAEKSRIEAEKVDAAAYERARGLYEAGIEQLEEQLRRLRDEIDSWRGRTTLAEDTATRLQGRVSELELTITQMRRQLILAGIEPPNGG